MKTSIPKKIVEENSWFKSIQVSIILFLVGIVLLFVFFPLGIIALFFAYFMFRIRNEEIYFYDGNCPKCQQPLQISGTVKDPENGARTCKFCKTRVILKNGVFECYD